MIPRLISFLAIALLSMQVFGATRIEPPKELQGKDALGTYLVDTGAGLDTGCTYRSGGPLVISVPIPEVVNPKYIDSNGYLTDSQKLIKNKVIGSQQVDIFFPSFDIDNEATGLNQGESPEIDIITFNGKTYNPSKMAGKNNEWVMQRFTIDIKELKFGPSAKNELRIDIDTANVGVGELWCTAVDWVAVDFDVSAPYVLAHGINSDLTTWDDASAPGVLNYLDELGVKYNRFSVTPNGSAENNGKDLEKKILPWLKSMKSDSVHMLAHSKGGLDSQAMVAQTTNKNEFKVLSLSTLSTPHMGSVASDLSLLELGKIDHYDKIENSSADPNKWVNAYLNAAWVGIESGLAPARPGLDDLKTSAYSSALSNRFRGNIPNTYSIGASADINSNGELDDSEANGMPVFGSEKLLRSAWHVIRDYSSAQFVRVDTRKGTIYGTNKVLVFSTTTAPTPQANDIMVSETSANPSYATPLGNVTANHSSIKNAAAVEALVARTITLR